MEIKNFAVKRMNTKIFNRWECSFYFDKKYLVYYAATAPAAVRGAFALAGAHVAKKMSDEIKSKTRTITLDDQLL